MGRPPAPQCSCVLAGAQRLRCRFDQLQAVPLEDEEATMHPGTVERDRLRPDVPETFPHRQGLCLAPAAVLQYLSAH